MSAPLLAVEDLVTTFATEHGEVRAVDGVSFEVPRGKTLGVVGESGCGKSVTALSILRLIPTPGGRIAGGRVLYDGQDLAHLPERQLQALRGNKISMIFQEPMTSLNPVFSVGEQVAEAVRIHQKKSRKEALARAAELFRLVGIPAPEERLSAYPHQLSGGMRQRVMIAMALALRPQLMVMDEPTTALDVLVQREILRQISQLRHEFGFSVIFITHDLPLLLEISDRIAIMRRGEIVELDTAERIWTQPKDDYTKTLLSSFPRLTAETRLTAERGVVSR